MRPALRLLCCLLIGSLLSGPSNAQFDPIGAAKGLIGQLNPVNLALGPLIDDAISKGNYALAQRLDQLQSIIQEALFNLNEIAEGRIKQVDQAAMNRITQMQTVANQQSGMLNDIISGRIKDIDTATEARIKQLGDTAGNLVEALPIPISALVDVPPTGFALVKEPGNETILFITGAGLFKQSEKPVAYIIKGNEKKPLLGHAGTSVTVKNASMGLLELSIPNSLFSDSSQPAECSLSLSLRKGPMFVPTHETPSFPILMCPSLPKYSVMVTQTAAGQYYEQRTVPYPSPINVPDGVYIDDNGSNNSADVCAGSFGGWEVDPEVAESGLEIRGEIKSHTDGSRVIPNNPRPGCYHLYAGKDSSGGGFAFVRGVFVHQRRLADTDQCEEPQVYNVDLGYGTANKVPTNPSKAIGKCAKAPSRTPALKTSVAIKDASGKILDQANLVPQGGGVSLLNGSVRASEDQFGLVQIDISSQCKRPIHSYSAVRATR